MEEARERGEVGLILSLFLPLVCQCAILLLFNTQPNLLPKLLLSYLTHISIISTFVIFSVRNYFSNHGFLSHKVEVCPALPAWCYISSILFTEENQIPPPSVPPLPGEYKLTFSRWYLPYWSENSLQWTFYFLELARKWFGVLGAEGTDEGEGY